MNWSPGADLVIIKRILLALFAEQTATGKKFPAALAIAYA